MKPELQEYVRLLRDGPHGLLSTGDLARVEAHIDDSLVGASTIEGLGARTVADVGTGGGMPGIPLALALPGITMTLVESLQWKAAFLERCRIELGLEDRLRVVNERVEEAPAAIGREAMDVCVARALAPPPVAAEYLAPLVRVGGSLLLWTTGAMASAAPLSAVGPLLGLGEPELRPSPSELRSDGALLVWPKVEPTPGRFPRRVGVARRRPLA